MYLSLSEEDLQKYKENNGMLCPVCGGSELTWVDLGWEAKGTSGSVRCSCGAEWIESHETVEVILDVPDGSKI